MIMLVFDPQSIKISSSPNRRPPAMSTIKWWKGRAWRCKITKIEGGVLATRIATVKILWFRMCSILTLSWKILDLWWLKIWIWSRNPTSLFILPENISNSKKRKYPHFWKPASNVPSTDVLRNIHRSKALQTTKVYRGQNEDPDLNLASNLELYRRSYRTKQSRLYNAKNTQEKKVQ